jgi:hypothetical protein
MDCVPSIGSGNENKEMNDVLMSSRGREERYPCKQKKIATKCVKQN